jgi:hypothetical protein
MSETDWTTRMPADLTRRYGVEELHSVHFAPKGWPGAGPTIVLGIPECEMHLCQLDKNGEPVVFINRPQVNKSIKSWMRTACSMAREDRLLFILSCDTADQAIRAAKLAAKLLPNHERVANERMEQAEARGRMNLN